jgi:hypothetical protein
MRPTWAIAALGLVLASCGAAEGNRFDLTTPGAHTGDGVPAATSAPNPTATSAATPAAKAEKKSPVTRTERRIIKGWSDSLRRGRVGAAARYFSVPTLVSNDAPGWEYLDTQSQIEKFNRGLTCGSKLIRARRGVDGFVVGIFKQVERKGDGADCGTGVGETAAVAFLIKAEHITRWVQIDPDAPAAGATPTPTATATASATPTTG